MEGGSGKKRRESIKSKRNHKSAIAIIQHVAADPKLRAERAIGERSGGAVRRAHAGVLALLLVRGPPPQLQRRPRHRPHAAAAAGGGAEEEVPQAQRRPECGPVPGRHVIDLRQRLLQEGGGRGGRVRLRSVALRGLQDEVDGGGVREGSGSVFQGVCGFHDSAWECWSC